MAGGMDIEVPRNGHYFQCWWMEAMDIVDGEDVWRPLDITAWTFSLDVKASAGLEGSPIASATFSGADSIAGTINVKLDGADFSDVDGKQEIVRLAYDCLAKDTDGIIMVQLRGQVILLPGVSTI